MKKCVLLSLFCSLFVFHLTTAQAYQIVKYAPLSQKDCFSHQKKLGLKYCPYDNDHLAGAALACGHINNLPSPDDLLVLARKVYRTHSSKKTFRGQRDDEVMKYLHIWTNEKRIFYWSNSEELDHKLGYIRMFAVDKSALYRAPRDGSGFLIKGFSASLGRTKYSKVRFKTPAITGASANDDSALFNHASNDVLLALCLNDRYSANIPNFSNIQTDANNSRTDANDERPDLRNLSHDSICAILCGHGFYYYKSSKINKKKMRICRNDDFLGSNVNPPEDFQKDNYFCEYTH